MPRLRRDLPRELGYAEVTSTQTTSSTTYADVTGWAVTVTTGSRPILVRAWLGAAPSSNTANSGGKYGLVRTDTGATICDHNFVSYAGAAPGSMSPLQRRLSLAAATTVTFKVQIATRVSGTATFGASTDLPLAIQVVEV